MPLKINPLAALATLCLCLAACYQDPSQPLPDNIIPPDQLVPILVDVHVAEGYLADVPSPATKDSLAAIYYATIFQHHHIDSAAFHQTMSAYMQNPNELSSIYEKVLQSLQVQDAESRKK